MTADVISFPGHAGVVGQPEIEVSAEPDDRLFWSVTTLLGAIDKPALLFWAAEQAALAAVHSESTWRGMLADDDPGCPHTSAASCAVIKWLRDARFRKPRGVRSATDLGTAVHAAAEEYELTGKRPEVDAEVLPFLDQYDRWLQRFSPVFEATEMAVYNPDLGYGGTLDNILVIDGVRFLADKKSTRSVVDASGNPTKPYPEQVAPQIAAYRHAKFAAAWRPRRVERFRRRYYALSPGEEAMAVPMPPVDTGLVIHITPESCEAYPIRCDDEVFEAFLAIRDSARWLYQTSKNVMSAPLVAPGGAR
ncbi:MAG: hypothetical protein IT341_10470 [Chloroflexi bacterium]|nr:hypothetical protein [Chloroflexota bacterium]